MPEPTKFSVVLPSYNQAKYVQKTLDSITSQNYPAVEIIVMDGGSSDGSVEIIQRYEEHIAYWQSKADGGQSAAINAGMQRASGELVCWLNSDDYFLPGTLQHVADCYCQNRHDNWWLAGASAFVSEDEQRVLHEVVTEDMCTNDLMRYGDGHYLPQPSVFFSKSLWENASGLNENLDYGMDLDLWLRFSKVVPFQTTARRLAMMRVHDDAKTVAQNDQAMREITALFHSDSTRHFPAQLRHMGAKSMKQLRAVNKVTAARHHYNQGHYVSAFKAMMDAATLSPAKTVTTLIEHLRQR